MDAHSTINHAPQIMALRYKYLSYPASQVKLYSNSDMANLNSPVLIYHWE